MRRAKKIERAIEDAKKRDGYRCIICGGDAIEGAHVLSRIVPFPWYHADSSYWIMTLCSYHHLDYDTIQSAVKKTEWLTNKGLTEWAQKLKKGLNGELHEAQKIKHP